MDKAKALEIANAAKAGVRIDSAKASYADFDFGTAKWDVIVLTFAWAPMDDAAKRQFAARMKGLAKSKPALPPEDPAELQGQAAPAAGAAVPSGT